MSNVMITMKDGSCFFYAPASMFAENGGIRIQAKTDPENPYREDVAFYADVKSAINTDAKFIRFPPPAAKEKDEIPEKNPVVA
jgi:hypothetical protein